MNIQPSRDFVLEQARLNISRVVDDPGFVERAKQVNASLASIVAMERNAVMLEAIKLRDKDENLPKVLNGGVETEAVLPRALPGVSEGKVCDGGRKGKATGDVSEARGETQGRELPEEKRES